LNEVSERATRIAEAASAYALSIEGVSRHFGALVALDGVDLKLRAGERHAFASGARTTGGGADGTAGRAGVCAGRVGGTGDGDGDGDGDAETTHDTGRNSMDSRGTPSTAASVAEGRMASLTSKTMRK
jgi:hypothetical protein